MIYAAELRSAHIEWTYVFIFIIIYIHACEASSRDGAEDKINMLQVCLKIFPPQPNHIFIRWIARHIEYNRSNVCCCPTKYCKWNNILCKCYDSLAQNACNIA